MMTTRTKPSTTLPADTRPTPHAPVADERGPTLLTEAELASVAAAGSKRGASLGAGVNA